MGNGIFQIFNSIHPLNEIETNSLSNIIKQKQLAKGEFWMQVDIPNSNIAFVQKGYLRKFYVKDGEEETDSFYFENEFCADLPSIIGKQKPDSSVVAMKATDLLILPYHEFQILCEKHYAFEHIYRILLEQAFLRFYKRTRSFIELTPKERYEAIVNSEPQILLNANQYHIASYIGISYQHLSRLRTQK